MWIISLRLRKLLEFTLFNFSEEETGFFFFAHRDQQDLLSGKRKYMMGLRLPGIP